MKFKTLLLAMVISVITLNAQTINLKIVNAQTQEAIPYAAVFSKDNKEGSYADEQGNLSFEFSPTVDTVLFSAVGFSLGKMSLKQALGSKMVMLTPSVVNLPDVTVSSRGAKIVAKEFGYFKRFRGFPTASSMTNVCNRFALLIHNSATKLGWITSVRIRFQASPSKIASSYRILLRVYQNNEGRPGEDILESITPVDIRNNQQSLILAIPWGEAPFPMEGVFVGYDVLGYSDSKGTFHRFKTGQKAPSKDKDWPDFLSPSIAVWQKEKTEMIYEANGLGKWSRSHMTRYGIPMFGIVASFKE